MYINPLLDPSTLATAGALGLGGYYLAHRLVGRGGAESLSVVRHRPPMPSGQHFGRTSFVPIGTYGVTQIAQRVGPAFVRANSHFQVGGMLVIELNEAKRTAIERELAGYRVVWAGSPFHKNGLGNAPIEYVTRDEVKVTWKKDVREAVDAFCRSLRRPGELRTGPSGVAIPHALEPEILWFYVSTGGHLALAIEAARMLRARFPDADCYATTILAEATRQREELVKALELHAKDPIFRLLFVSENRQDWKRNDRRDATFMAGVWQSHQIAGGKFDPYNLFHNLYQPHAGDGGCGIAVLSGWEQDLAVYHTPLPPIEFWIHRDDAVREVLRGILAVAEPSAKCAPLRTPLPGTPRYVLVDIPLKQPYLDMLVADISERLQDIDWKGQDPNRELLFSSLSQDLTRSTKYVRVSVMMIEAATDGVDGLKRLALCDRLREGGTAHAGAIQTGPQRADPPVQPAAAALDRATVEVEAPSAPPAPDGSEPTRVSR